MFTLATLFAAICFSLAGLFMKLSEGLTVLGPSLVMLGLVVVGAMAQTLAMRHQGMAVTYVVVVGLEVVAALAVSHLLLGERPAPVHLAGTALVVTGVLLLQAPA